MRNGNGSQRNGSAVACDEPICGCSLEDQAAVRFMLSDRVCEDARRWLAPLLAGGLSAARTSPIGPTAERLAETILIALENTIRGNAKIFNDCDDEIPF